MAPRICTPMHQDGHHKKLCFPSACTLPNSYLSLHSCLHKLCLCIREQCPELLKINTNYLLFLNAKIYIYTILSNSFLKLKVNYLFCILQGVQESRTPRGRGDTSPFRDNKDSSKFYHLIHKPVCEHEGRQPGIFLCLGVIMIIHFIKT